jgi:hypothetical protein
MRLFFETLGWFAGLLAVSVAVSWLFTALRERGRRRVSLDLGAPLKIRANLAVYRSRLLSAGSKEWAFDAPLQRDAYVPLPVGESLTVESGTPKGLIRFKTTIVGRDPRAHSLLVEPPRDVLLVERRAERRKVLGDPEPAEVDGNPAILLDLSEGGAKVWVQGPIARGERLSVGIIGLSEPIYAWALEAWPAPMRGDRGMAARLRFEDPLDHKVLHKEKTPA